MQDIESESYSIDDNDGQLKEVYVIIAKLMVWKLLLTEMDRIFTRFKIANAIHKVFKCSERSNINTFHWLLNCLKGSMPGACESLKTIVSTRHGVSKQRKANHTPVSAEKGMQHIFVYLCLKLLHQAPFPLHYISSSSLPELQYNSIDLCLSGSGVNLRNS